MKKKWIAMVTLTAILCSLFVGVHAEESILKERIIVYSNTGKNVECGMWIDNDHNQYTSFVKSGIEMHSKGYAMKITYNGLGATIVQLIRPDSLVYDISSFKDNAYLSFWMYIETDSKVEPDARNLAVCLRNTKAYNYAKTGDYHLSTDMKAGVWNHVLISVEEMGIDTSRGEFDFSQIYRIDLKRTTAIEEDWNVYVQDISFYEKIYGPEVTVAESGMNTENGMFYTELQFSNAMDDSTLTVDQFTLEGISCNAVNYKKDTKTCVLQFDTMPAPQKAQTLLLGDKIMDTEGLKPQIKEYIVQLPASQEEIAAKITAAPSISNGVLSCTASLQRIYAPVVGEVAVYFVLYQDDCLVADSITQYGEMAWKSSVTKTPSLEVPKDVTAGKLRAEIYVIDAETFGRPLTKVLQYEL